MNQPASSGSNGKEFIEGITKVSVKGFKSLCEECTIEVQPLTILAGTNSSGKSSMMQPLLMMKQTLEATYDPGALLLNGPNVRFTSVQQLLSRFPNKPSSNSFEIEIETDGYSSVRNTYGKTSGTIEILQAVYQEEFGELAISPGMPEEEILALISRIKDEEDIDFYSSHNYWEGGEPKAEELRYEIKRERCFLEFECGYKREIDRRSLYLSLYDSGEHNNLVEAYIREIIHVPGLRANLDRSYKVTAIDSTGFGLKTFSGRFDDYVASVINFWRTNEDTKILDLEIFLALLGLTSKLAATRVNDVEIELRVGRLATNHISDDLVNIADVGLGISQILPVLVALLVAESGQLVYIEQPELHLHPRAQFALAEVLANAANRGVRVVTETHSELLLLGIQSLVAEGKLATDKVKLHWFMRQEDGSTKISSADLDEAGAFGDWPEDFSDVSLGAENRYLSAAEARLWKQ